MERFNPGDRVVCVKPSHHLLCGKVYTVDVDEDEDSFGGRLVYFKELPGEGYFHWRVMLHEAAADVGTFPFLIPGPGRV